MHIRLTKTDIDYNFRIDINSCKSHQFLIEKRCQIKERTLAVVKKYDVNDVKEISYFNKSDVSDMNKNRLHKQKRCLRANLTSVIYKQTMSECIFDIGQ